MAQIDIHRGVWQMIRLVGPARDCKLVIFAMSAVRIRVEVPHSLCDGGTVLVNVADLSRKCAFWDS